MSVSKRIRFEVFKRDQFTCQYCGAQAPDVVLHADHIEPKSKGGSDDIMNLISACQSCNLGKGARTLDDKSVVEKRRKQAREESAHLEALRVGIDETQIKAEAFRATNWSRWREALESKLYSDEQVVASDG